MAEDKKPSVFNSKKLTRNIIPISIAGIILLAMFAFVMKYGVTSNTPEKKAREENAKKQQIDNVASSAKISEEQAKQDLGVRQKNAQKEISEKNNGQNDVRMMLANANRDGNNADFNQSYPNQPVPQPGNGSTAQFAPPNQQSASIDAYEARKNSLYTSQKPAGLSMVAFESGSSVAGMAGQAGDLARGMAQAVETDDQRRARQTAELQKAYANQQPANPNQDPNSAFNDSAAKDSLKNGISDSIKVEIPPSRFMVMEGATINTVLLSAIDSQLPNKLLTKVTQDVYDSIHGEYLLIPAGTVITGSYNSNVSQGQDRVFISFTRMIFPNGSSVQLGAMPAGDAQGRGGVEGDVITQFWRAMGSSMLIAGVGVFADQQRTTVNNYGGSVGISSAAGQILAETARTNIQRFAQYKPRIRVAAGEKLTIVVAKDMDLNPEKTTKDPK